MIIFILMFGLGLRITSLNQSLWIDEATSAMTTKMSLVDFFNKFLPGDFHPPLYYLALRAWGSVFGTSEIALRSLSILFGILTIYLVYLVGKKLINKEAGIIASLLLATSGLHIYYSQEARMYSMSTFLVTLLIFSFVKITREKKRGIWWFMFSLVLGIIGLTDYLPLLILIPIWIYVLVEKKKVDWWKKFIMSHIILVIFGVLWFPLFYKQLTSGINVTNTSPSWVQVLGSFSVKNILLIPVKFVIGRAGFDNKFIYGSVIGFGFLVFGYLIYKSARLRKTSARQGLIYLWLIIPLIIGLVVSIKIPVLNYFRFLFVLPAFYLLAASGVNTMKGKLRIIFLIFIIGINLITSFMYLTNMKFQKENWRNAVSFIEINRGENSIVVFPALSQMEAYRYYTPDALIYGPKAIKKGYSSIWLVRYAQPISDPQDSTRKEIEDLGYLKIKEFDFNGVTVWEYNSAKMIP